MLDMLKAAGANAGYQVRITHTKEFGYRVECYLILQHVRFGKEYDLDRPPVYYSSMEQVIDYLKETE